MIPYNIETTRKNFEESFKEENFYNKQTADNNHLELLLHLIDPEPNSVILDLGTGSGYVAFMLAERYPDCRVIGLDIITETLERNRKKAALQSNYNLSFLSYDGMKYPFEDESIDIVVTRYALHHFPNLADSFKEVYRILKNAGKIVIADPTPNRNDTSGFVDEYMRVKPDGHIKFYSFAELNEILETAGFQYRCNQISKIRFPRKNPSAYQYLFEKYDSDIWEGYNITIADNEIWITENVLNMVYKKV